MKRLAMGIVLVSMLGLAAAEAQVPGKWVKLAPFPEPAEELYGVAAGGKLYVFGGIAPGWKPRGLAFEYDPATDQWGTVRARMPTPRSAVAWGVHGGKIYVAGGEYQDDKLMAAFRALEAYDPAANRWTVLPRMPIPRHGLAGAVIGNRLHLVSGDVQSAGIGGMPLHSESHDAFEIADK